MQRKTACVVAATLFVMVFSGLQVSLAEDPEGTQPIGTYVRLGMTDDLKPDHVSRTDGTLTVEGPVMSSKLRVETAFLEAELGAWGSDRAFSPGDGFVEFDSGEASFAPLELGAQAVFTWGNDAQVRFVERPMWINVEQDGYGGTITLDMQDDDSTGQSVFIAKSWLWERGIHRPSATHEDGTVLPVNQSEDRSGFFVDVHHFSVVEISPPELDVKGRQSGVVFPHLEEVRWFPEDIRLEVDVEEKVTDYELLVETDWVDMHFPNPAVEGFDWAEEKVDGINYYTVYLFANQTPETVIFVTVEYRFILNMTKFSEAVGSGNGIELPYGENKSFSLLVNVTDWSDQFTVWEIEDNGTETLRSENLRILEGQGGPGNVSAYFYEDRNVSVSGTVKDIDSGVMVSYRSIENSTLVLLPEERELGALSFCWRRIEPPDAADTCGPNDGEPPGCYPHCPPVPPTARDITLVAFLENSFESAHPNALTMVEAAATIQRDMWLEYTGNTLVTLKYTSVHDMWEDTCEDHHDTFREYLDESIHEDTGDVFTLFTGKSNLDCGCGSAKKPNAGHLVLPWPSNLVSGVACGSVNTEIAHHLGGAWAHEIGHTWGEPDHSCEPAQDTTHSIMCNAAGPNNKAFWLHYGDPNWDCSKSTERIISGTAQYDGGSGGCTDS